MGSLQEVFRVVVVGVDGVIVQGVEVGGYVCGMEWFVDFFLYVKEVFLDYVVCGVGGVYDGSSVEFCWSLGVDVVCVGMRFVVFLEVVVYLVYKQ